MDYKANTETSFASRGTTLSALKEQMYSLNMRLRLAMQLHDEGEQARLKTMMDEIQEEIDGLGLGRGH